MRAIYWYQIASSNARGLLKAEIDEAIKKQEELLAIDRRATPIPRFASPNAESNSPVANIVMETPEALHGMLGRVLVDGMDAGVMLRYETGVEVNDAQVVDILSNVNRKGESVRIEMIGLLLLKKKAEIKLIQLAGSSQMGFGQIAVDGKVIGQMGGQNTDTPSAYTITLEPGEHRIVWSLSGGKLGSCRLQAQLAETNEAVPLVYSTTLLNQMKSLPTPLRVNLVRNKAKRT
jgi:hypothetical protein